MNVPTNELFSPQSAADTSARGELGETWRRALGDALRDAMCDAVRHAAQDAARGAVRDAAQDARTEQDVLVHAVGFLIASASTYARGGFADLPNAAATGPRWTSPRGASASRGSAAGHWATYVLRGCSAGHDPKTIADWARLAHLSYSGLCESCRLVHVRPKDARDFTRMLRVVLHAPGDVDAVGALLDVSARRTRDLLLTRGGFGRDWLSTGAPTLAAYLAAQHFVSAGNCGLHAVATLLGVAPGQ